MYVYAIFCIGLCIGTAFMGFSAFAVTRRKLLLYLSTFVLCYAVEQIVIFYNEFVTQNLPFQSEIFESMEDPALRVVTGAVLCQTLWLAFLEFFNDCNGFLIGRAYFQLHGSVPPALIRIFIFG